MLSSQRLGATQIPESVRLVRTETEQGDGASSTAVGGRTGGDRGSWGSGPRAGGNRGSDRSAECDLPPSGQPRRGGQSAAAALERAALLPGQGGWQVRLVDDGGGLGVQGGSVPQADP